MEIDHKAENARLRDRSESVDRSGPLTAFFYDLLRDHLPAATVETLVREAAAHAEQRVQYTNGYLAEYANELSDRLRSADIAAFEAQALRAYGVFNRACHKDPGTGVQEHFVNVIKMLARGYLP